MQNLTHFCCLLCDLNCADFSGTTVKIKEDEDSWAVLIVTPIMKRAQELPASQEIIFTDSTSSCDSENTTVTVMLTATKAGAVPIAVMLHPGTKQKDYVRAYSLLKEEFPKCFGMNEVRMSFPSIPVKTSCK